MDTTSRVIAPIRAYNHKGSSSFSVFLRIRMSNNMVKKIIQVIPMIPMMLVLQLLMSDCHTKNAQSSQVRVPKQERQVAGTGETRGKF